MVIMGLSKNIESPELLFQYFEEYEKWCKENPRHENLLSKDGEIIKVPRERPMTWQSFESWLFKRSIISELDDYRYNKGGRYSEFAGIISRIQSIMYADKFEGAAVGIYQHTIIIRELGLVEQQKTESTNTILWGENSPKDELKSILGENDKGI